MKYEVGDKVKIREDLEANKMYGAWDCSTHMAHWSGMIATIVQRYDNYYRIDVDNKCYNWTDEMFEDKIVRHDDNDETDNDETMAQTVDIGYYLEYCGDKVIKNVYYGGYAHDTNHVFCTTVDGKNQYTLPIEAIEFIIPHEVD